MFSIEVREDGIDAFTNEEQWKKTKGSINRIMNRFFSQKKCNDKKQTFLWQDYDSSLLKPISAKKCVAVMQGTEKEASFNIEQYDTLWFKFLLEGFLFINGFITTEESFFQPFYLFLNEHNLNKKTVTVTVF